MSILDQPWGRAVLCWESSRDCATHSILIRLPQVPAGVEGILRSRQVGQAETKIVGATPFM